MEIVHKMPFRLHFLQLLSRPMAKVLISFENSNVRLRTGRWLFKRNWPMRFEWIALMAYKQLTKPADQTWVDLEEIARLPNWGGKSRHDTSTNVGRYLQSIELRNSSLVTARTIWSGPYRLNVHALSTEFDIPILEVRKRLRIRAQPASIARRAALIRFTHSFARAQWLIFQGRLQRARGEGSTASNAYQVLMRMTEERSYTPALQFLALLSAVDVLFRLGRFQAARRTLINYRHRLCDVCDSSLRARFYLKLAWAFQRGSSGIRSDRAVEAALESATFHAQNSGDRAALGMVAHRIAGYQTKKGLHVEAINQLVVALEADLVTGNYDNIQRACGDIGSIVHRLGLKHYDEARQWLLLSVSVARMMKLGRDDAHAEMILGKIYVERGDRNRSRWLLERAKRVAGRAGNRLNLADVKMVFGFWYERFGTHRQLIETLRGAMTDFRNLSEFDARQKERYMERSFPSVWQEVATSLEHPQTA
jgi:hypothetical protein